MIFRPRDYAYDLLDDRGQWIASYDKLGHALHHYHYGHPIEPGCCDLSDRNGNDLSFRTDLVKG
jgi:hypothetical protein